MEKTFSTTNGPSDASQSRIEHTETSITTPSNNAAETQPHSKPSSATTSLTPSPYNSRDTSPSRKAQKPVHAPKSASTPGLRSRKSSQQDLTAVRTPRSNTNIPGPATSSRTLSAATTPTLLPNSQESFLRSINPQKAPLNTEVAQTRDSPRWPVSPRLRSPPPQLNKPHIPPTTRKGEQEAPRVNLTKASPTPQPDRLPSMSESETDDSLLPSGVRTPVTVNGSTLETVQEVSLPNSPGQMDSTLEQVNEKLAHEAAVSAESLATQVDNNRTIRLSRGALQAHDNMGDNGTLRVRSQSSAPAPTVTRQSSVLSNKQGKSKATGEGSSLIVETETVSSIPQVALAPASKLEVSSGTLRAKPSTETIRPKKDKKKTSRKQPTVNSGNASSKADIFEAKVASAVDEANTSDSEETFVYDSNPPDVDRRRFHSRTPSATSMISQADRPGGMGMRSIHEALQGSGAAAAAVGLKKSMKFVNTFNSNGAESLGVDEDGKGSGRSVGPGSGRGTSRHHHHNHFGRWGRQPGNSHPSLFDNESLFPNAARSKLSGNTSRQSSGPPSPRVASSARGGPHALGKRSSIQMARYDAADDTTTTGADDERTPLISSTVRSSRRSRRQPANLRNLESQTYRQQPSYLNRFAACLVVTMMLLLVITGAIGFMFATSQPLTDIQLVSVKNVLASDPELMFDLTVKAHNPNIVVVSIDQANLEIFAKSPHAGTDFDWWKRPHEGELGDPDMHIRDYPPDDPPDEDNAPNMRLGTIMEFDSPLSFEGSFFNKGVSASTGTMRLHLPGNHSAGGSERWGRIIQDEFDLIVKGVVRYSLPLSQRVRSAPISGRTTVKPNSANDPSLRPNTTLPGEVPGLEP
ncbi:phospholipid metabolism enzyme regulator [Colletotrichum scovillei]|uniref:Phospholipid metabolism enzyme regulator n=1 Tax=Colletotrichum scovillei TaxID=1209932 RepID=A0A9P7RD70_9PEZI|nr:phospholipid metabolism enzyme regulator [Colletotrichum scovillei]KAF4784972.1 phospholipid metabolism enzyme regulator [Colletotrichum scovillei]KAG7055070.1 phospholipid metabolism enzyme regulator [Colletotrichum scovillei]KAG7074515.1 phospholipid metabolism enzyme regulator [Colletotrichum scovillei]KAG7081637.1 phospholipid metabolism enzyme regulator [Colletotrichum scovillei]